MKRLQCAFRSISNPYDRLLVEHPIKTKSFTAGFMYICGDITSQVLEHTSDNTFSINWIRTSSMFIPGCIFDGYICHLWYNYINKIPRIQQSLRLNEFGVLKMKLFLDQIVFGPVQLLLLFLSYGVVNRCLSDYTYQSNQSIIDIFKRTWNHTKEVMLPAFINSCWYWPPVQYINFKYIPLRYQVLYINVASFIFNIYVSFMANKTIE